MSQSSKKSQSSEPGQPAWKAHLKPANLGLFAAVLLVCGLAFLAMSGSDGAATSDDITDEEVVMGFGPKPLGAMGVSDSASPSDQNAPPPLEFPATDVTSRADAAPTQGPLFGAGPRGFEPAPKTDPITSASFERPASQPSGLTTGRQAPITPRATANQPVWLTGTIEASPNQ